MKFRCSIWTLWTTFACTTAPNIENTPTPPALSFVFSPTGVYELEDTPALIWRNNNKRPTAKMLYFFYTIFACPELSVDSRTIQKNSTSKSLAFIWNIMEPQEILNFITHPLFCQKLKRYHPSAVPITRSNNEYIVNPNIEGNPHRQVFSIGYEVKDEDGRLNKKRLPSMERFEGMAEGSGWLEAFKVVYDTKNFIARQVLYELNFFGESETAPGKCGNYDVGRVHEFFREISFSNAYRRKPRVIVQSEGSQPSDDESYGKDDNELIYNKHTRWDSEEYFGVGTLTDSNTPTTIPPNSNTEGESSKSTKRSQPTPAAFEEESDEEYMVMQQLAPIEYFDVFSIQWSTCSYLNVMPMWRSLATGPWKRVDQAIRKMLYVIDKLSIVAGNYGILKLPKWRSNDENGDVFLRSNIKRIAVPELFYKFVVHKVPHPVRSDASLLFGIIIVMHNKFGVQTNRICQHDPVDLCYKYGWDVGSEDDEIAKPYCCRPSPATLKLLVITSYASLVHDFNLNNVLVEITGDGQNVVRNYNQFLYKENKVVAKKRAKTKKLNDIYF